MAPKPKSPKKRALKALSKGAADKMWAEMRREFESTEIGIRELARKYGIRSHTTVLRHVNDEDWRKQPAEIAANIATEGVIDTLLAASSVAKSGSAAPLQGPPGNIKDTDGSSDSSNKRTGFEAGPLAVANQSGAGRAGRRMALVQQEQLLKEIRVADQVLDVSTRMLTMLMEVMQEEDLLRANQIVSRFSAIGGKTESFSGLVRAATAALEKGVTMRRRALNMEGKLGLGAAGTGQNGGDIPEQVKTLLPTLSTTELLELRRAATMLNKQIQNAAPVAEQNVIEGVADAILGPEG